MCGFSALQGLGNLRPQDYINYLKLVSSTNGRVEKAQFHAVISGKGRMYGQDDLTAVAKLWMEKMGYGSQPYLAVFHGDTDNNHIHLISTRIGKDGKKISSAFENRRAVHALQEVLGYHFALQYNLSTKAQFYLLLESRGYLGRNYNPSKLDAHIAGYKPDKVRMGQLRELLILHKDDPAFTDILKTRYQVELIFHAADGKAPYGYTILDHGTQQVFKGSEVLSLKYLGEGVREKVATPTATMPVNETSLPASYVGPVWIADDVDDEAVLGMKRRRKGKARKNTR
ncbi:relaxase/mobilization nuclease domain-containing protein [Mucilaginibacter terrae]|uniref:relaxase/mobilization nuclease domain-containing protein n=1 Tax=Mucilaginibacter terrae TaxID=1955052 RepID=UPI00289E2BB9|nr:relaxase/mobilization nuclease domain-containing protein [Mucilaginibacter terrae]